MPDGTPEPTVGMAYALEVVKNLEARIELLERQIPELVEEINDCDIYITLHSDVPVSAPDGEPLSLLGRIELLCEAAHA